MNNNRFNRYHFIGIDNTKLQLDDTAQPHRGIPKVFRLLRQVGRSAHRGGGLLFIYMDGEKTRNEMKDNSERGIVDKAKYPDKEEC